MAEIINNRYVLHDKLGEGGMGAVYRATDRLHNTEVALKRVLVEQDVTPEEAEEARLALSFEFRTLASLRHPNIVTVMDYGFDDQQQPYFTMRLLDQPRTIRAAAKGQSLTYQLLLILSMLQAVAYLHRRGVVHRDLKPGNVLVTPDDAVHVVDFGLSTALTQSMRNADQQLAGTLNYMAPELFRGQDATFWSDLWSVGVIVFSIFADKHPFDTTNTATLVTSIMSDEPDFDAIQDNAVLAFVRPLLAREPDARYPSAEAVIQSFMVMVAALGETIPQEDAAIRESFLQASAFIGHQRELYMLKNSLGQIAALQGSAWLIAGESGVGKSRLIEEIRIRALVQGVLVLFGQGVAEAGVPYHFWREPLRRLVLEMEVSDAEARSLKQIIPDIERLIGREVSGITRGQPHLVNTIIGLFNRYQCPTLLILEDLQWALESLIPLQSLLEMTPHLPLMILASYRDDEKPELAEQLPGMKLLKLDRLSDDEIEQLTVSMLGESGERPQVIDFLKRETEGNVFFLVEVVRALAEEAGTLADIGHMTLPEHVVAGGIVQVVQRRLRRIPEEGQALLKVAAVIGRQIDLDLLVDLNPEIDLEAWLAICTNAAVLESNDGIWRFTHDRLRESLLEQLTGDERRRIHRQVAQAIEARYPDDLDQVVQLAEHWRMAEDIHKTFHYVLLAAEQAHKIHAYQETLAYTEQALRLLSRLEKPDRRPYHARLEHQLGAAYRAQGNLIEARRHLQLSAGLYYKLGDKGQLLHVLNDLGRIDQDEGRYVAARECHQTALTMGREIESKDGVASALICLGTVGRATGRYQRAKQHFEESIALYRQIDDQEAVADSLSHLGLLAYDMGNYQEAQGHFEERLSMGLSIGHPVGIAEALHHLGMVSAIQGDYGAAISHYRESLTISRRIGNRRHAASVLQSMGHTAADQRLELAHEYFRESLMTFRMLGDQPNIASVMISMGALACQEIDYNTAEGYYQTALDIYREIELNAGILTGLAALGELARLRGKHQEALTHYKESFDIAREDGIPSALVKALTGMALTYVDVEDHTHAKECVRRALKIAAKTQSPRDFIQTMTGFAYLLVATGQVDQSARVYGLIANHAATPYHILHFDLAPLREQIKALLTEDALKRALEQGRNLNPQVVAERLLVEEGGD